MKLTQTAIAKMPKPLAGDEWLWDSELPGLGVKHAASGRKTYVVRYRTKAGVARKQTLARCDVVSPEKAREMARKIMTAVAEGRDPMAEQDQARKPAPDCITMEVVKERFMGEHSYLRKKARSITQDETAWNRHILPALGARPVASITKVDVEALHRKLKDTPAAANYAIAVLGKAFNLCEEWGWRDPNTNPCHRFKKFKIAGRTLILTPEQIGALDRACTALVDRGGKSGIRAVDAALIRLWMMTGCRNSELRLAKRAWVDRAISALRLPDSKTGERVIPLPAAAMAIIDTLPADSEWLFPGVLTGRPIAHPYGLWRRLCALAGAPERATPHTLRHTAGSLGHAAGLSQQQIADQLGHAQLATTEIYLHGVESEKAKAAEKIAQAVTAHWA